jgi:hypothetical protein|tara:strand:- start:763 stop:1341 length:579 start_codon:yes stop_codon:yes gene_type:complete
MAKDFAPWSAETAQGIKTDPVDSNINVRQEVVPAVNVGTISTLTGEWVGVPTSDEVFSAVTTHINVADGAAILVPATGQESFIDMTGFLDIQIAIKPTNGGNCAIEAVMGPDTFSYGNLTPVNSAAGIRGNQEITGKDCDLVFRDTAESLTANVWNILLIRNVLKDTKLTQFKITNNSGGISTIEFAYLRLV